MGALCGRRGALAGGLKPLGRKNYGSIGHLPGSRLGSGDHHVHEGQARIACEKERPADFIIVQEKLDGSNVGVARLEDGSVVALSRAGYLAQTSPHQQHHRFAAWVRDREEMFRSLLETGQRVVGEWLDVAHGTRYELPHEPFVVLDLMVGAERALWIDVDDWAEDAGLPMPCILGIGSAMSVEAADAALGEHGRNTVCTGVAA